MNLHEYIKFKGENISSLSKKVGIPYTTLHNGINNPMQMRFKNIKKLCNYFEISLDDISEMIDEKDEVLLLTILRDQMESRLKGNIYHFTQVNFAYNTNRIEGSKLTEDQTRFIFETNTIGAFDADVNTDDLVETSNTFYLFDQMLKAADQTINEEMILSFHKILKNGTSDARKSWFAVGEYKKLPNEVGGKETTPPSDVGEEMNKLIQSYNAIAKPGLEDIMGFHNSFEKIHPFQDGNGRIGRIIIFKECLKNNIVPFIIEDDFKSFYYRGLSNYENDKNYLVDICLSMQDKYKLIIEKYVGTLIKSE